MAVRLEGPVKRYIGSSTDDKPMDDIPSGSSFLETNTQDIFRFDGRMWVKTTNNEEENSLYFERIIRLLEDMRDLLMNL